MGDIKRHLFCSHLPLISEVIFKPKEVKKLWIFRKTSSNIFERLVIMKVILKDYFDLYQTIQGDKEATLRLNRSLDLLFIQLYIVYS